MDFSGALNWIGETIFNALNWVVGFLNICPLPAWIDAFNDGQAALLSGGNALYWDGQAVTISAVLSWIDYWLDVSYFIEFITASLPLLVIMISVSAVLRFLKLKKG